MPLLCEQNIEQLEGEVSEKRFVGTVDDYIRLLRQQGRIELADRLAALQKQGRKIELVKLLREYGFNELVSQG